MQTSCSFFHASCVTLRKMLNLSRAVSSSVKWAKNTPQGKVKIPDTVPCLQHGVGSTNGPEEKLGGPSPTAVPIWLFNFTHVPSLYQQRDWGHQAPLHTGGLYLGGTWPTEGGAEGHP